MSCTGFGAPADRATRSKPRCSHRFYHERRDTKEDREEGGAQGRKNGDESAETNGAHTTFTNELEQLALSDRSNPSQFNAEHINKINIEIITNKDQRRTEASRNAIAGCEWGETRASEAGALGERALQAAVARWPASLGGASERKRDEGCA